MKKPVHTILITGASGMLGSKLVEILSKKFTVISDRFDITHAGAIAMIRKRFKNIDSIIHCAAMTDVNTCEKRKTACWKTNVRGTEHITRLAKHYGAQLIYISTPMVFSGQKGNYREHDRQRPQNHYARSKLAAEKIVLRYPCGLVTRVNPIGKRPPASHPSFIQWFVERARKNESFSLFSDVVINPISTMTMGRIIDRILRNFKPGIIHLGSRDVVNKADVWHFILKQFPNFSGIVKEQSVDTTSAGKIAKRPHLMWLNTDLVQKSYKIRMPSWRNEINHVLKEL